MLLTAFADRRRARTNSAGFAPRGATPRRCLAALAAGAALLASGALATPALARSHKAIDAAARYQFSRQDNPGDPTFNQLLGINNRGLIAGYFGSGAVGHPNQGYLLTLNSGPNYTSENFPGSTQTQVTGLNDRGISVGFWSDTNAASNNANFGFYERNGIYYSVDFPTASNSTPPVNQLLGVNDRDVAVGFYTDSNGDTHGYTYDIRTNRYREVTIDGATDVTAAAINNSGDIAGFETDAAGNTHGFLMRDRYHVIQLDYPGASMTQALGVNDSDEVVGVYQVGTGNAAVTNGFTWTPRRGFQTVDDPSGTMGTTINGVNDSGQLVGFYTDAANNTHGLIASPGM